MTLELHGVHKDFAGVEVLHGVDLTGRPGEVLAVVGANGAGKSTLIKILSGALPMSAGEISLDGARVHLGSPHDAHDLGIRTVYQELSLVRELSVTENLLMGNFPRRFGLIDWPSAHRRARALLDEAGFGMIDPRARAGRLSVARQQMVEIAKALVSEPRVLILDEPSAVLAGSDLDALFALIRTLQQRGVLVVYVSHRLVEVLDLATTIVVMKDGRVIATTTPAQTSEAELIRLMAGRQLDRIYPARRPAPGGTRLAVRHLSRPGEFADVSFDLHAGEIVGLFGLVGSGRSELAACVFGATRPATGTVEAFQLAAPGPGADDAALGADETQPRGNDDAAPGGGDDAAPGGGDDAAPGGGDDAAPRGSDSAPSDGADVAAARGSSDAAARGSDTAVGESGAEALGGDAAVRGGDGTLAGSDGAVRKGDKAAAPRGSGRAGGFASPQAAIGAGLAMVTEDRAGSGLVLGMTVRDNIGLTTWRSTGRGPLIDAARQRRDVAAMIERLGIQPARCATMPVRQLSGGNQQKAVLAKWLLVGPKVLILDEPTRGVDMATRVDIYRMVDDLAREGLAVLLISSDLIEVLGATDRVLVMNQGRLVGELRSEGATEDQVLERAIAA